MAQNDIKKVKCEMEINWVINDFCNFNCVYCYPGAKMNKFSGLQDISKITEGFNRTGRQWMIYISGGEPFMFPRFVDLCEKLTDKHIISVNSNISHGDVFRFAERIDPARVRCFHCSVHIQERERLKLVKDFIKKYNFLKNFGFYVYASYVLYPPLVKRFKKDYTFFKSEGIMLRPKIFRGEYMKLNRKLLDFPVLKKLRHRFELTYPDAYSPAQRKRIISYIEQSQKDGHFGIGHQDDAGMGRLSDVYLDASFIKKLPSFKGKYCMAGKAFVRMTPTGEVFRCYDDDSYLGNLFDSEIRLFENPEKCRAPTCHCPYIGHRHVLQHYNESENEDRTLLSTILNHKG